MKIFSPARLAYRTRRSGVRIRGLLWIEARHRDTGELATIGFWTGDDHEVFLIDGESRPYFGAGGLLDLGVNTAVVGLKVRSRTLKLSAVSPEVRQALSVYDARLARVEIHRAEFDPETDELIDVPERVEKGWINTINWATGREGGEAVCSVSMMNSVQALTRSLTLKFSDAAQRLVNSTDRLFRYVDLSTQTDVWWGEERISGGSLPSSILGVPIDKWKIRRS